MWTSAVIAATGQIATRNGEEGRRVRVVAQHALCRVSATDLPTAGSSPASRSLATAAHRNSNTTSRRQFIRRQGQTRASRPPGLTSGSSWNTAECVPCPPATTPCARNMVHAGTSSRRMSSIVAHDRSVAGSGIRSDQGHADVLLGRRRRYADSWRGSLTCDVA